MGIKLDSSILRKVAMALSGLFLIIFLTQHFIINITSVFSSEIFNMFSHFMGNNFIVQFIAQPILIFGVLFHFIMGFYLDIIASFIKILQERSFKLIIVQILQLKTGINMFL